MGRQRKCAGTGFAARAFTLLLTLAASVPAIAEEPANPFDYSRTVDYTYDALGRVATVTTQKDVAGQCSVSTFTPDAFGNLATTQLANCAGAAGRAVFATRSSGGQYTAVPTQTIKVAGVERTVSIAAGIVRPSVVNELGYETRSTFDPRFGLPLTTLDVANNRASSVAYDDFGRVARVTDPTGSSAVTLYCVLASTPLSQAANSEGCPLPSPQEVPPLAAMFVHKEPRSPADLKDGPFTRTYVDRLGRVLRTVTESFDAPSQPASHRGQLVAVDTRYNAFRPELVELQTQPYFLDSGTASTDNSADVRVTHTLYDVLGRPVARFASDESGVRVPEWHFADWRGLPSRQRAALTTYTYTGLTTTEENDLGQTRVSLFDPMSRLLKVTDALGAQLSYRYDAFGNLLGTRDALGNTTAATYDLMGRRVAFSDPDKGLVTHCYDAIGQLKASQSSNMRGSHTRAPCPNVNDSGNTATAVAQWTTFAYDKARRMTARVDDRTSRWYFDRYADSTVCPGGVGALCEVTVNTDVRRRYAYDGSGRLTQARLDVGSKSMATKRTYDATGRLIKLTYPTGLEVAYDYTAGLKFLSGVKLASATTGAAGAFPAGTVLWAPRVLDATGAVEQAQVANGVLMQTVRAGASGRPFTLRAGLSDDRALHHEYEWDSLNNLRSRHDHNGDALQGAVTETFEYDRLNRLVHYQVAGAGIPSPFSRAVVLHYNALGSMLHKSDVGNYAYVAAGQAQPHRARTVAGTTYGADLEGNVLTASAGKYRTLTYTQAARVATLAGAAGQPSYDWGYDEANQRVRETRTAGTNVRNVFYFHPDALGSLEFEREENTGSSPWSSNRHYVSVGGSTVAVIGSAAALPSLAPSALAPPPVGSLAVNRLDFWHKDHLGSLVSTTNAQGEVTARFAYDPFGKNRHADGRHDGAGAIVMDWHASAAGSARGFTGHEQRDDVGIVNMNGRIYDATASHFLQADMKVPDPSNLQDFNRYAYVRQNPLNATDPSGFDRWGAESSPSGWSGYMSNIANDPFAMYGGGSSSSVVNWGGSSFSSGTGMPGFTFQTNVAGSYGQPAGIDAQSRSQGNWTSDFMSWLGGTGIVQNSNFLSGLFNARPGEGLAWHFGLALGTTAGSACNVLGCEYLLPAPSLAVGLFGVPKRVANNVADGAKALFSKHGPVKVTKMNEGAISGLADAGVVHAFVVEWPERLILRNRESTQRLPAFVELYTDASGQAVWLAGHNSGWKNDGAAMIAEAISIVSGGRPSRMYGLKEIDEVTAKQMSHYGMSFADSFMARTYRNVGTYLGATSTQVSPTLDPFRNSTVLFKYD